MSKRNYLKQKQNKKEQKINTRFPKKGVSAYVTPLPLISLKFKCDFPGAILPLTRKLRNGSAIPQDIETKRTSYQITRENDLANC